MEILDNLLQLHLLRLQMWAYGTGYLLKGLSTEKAKPC